MKREDLKALGLADDVIDKIMEENGKDIEKHKSDASTAKATVEQLKTQVAERDTQLETLKKLEPEKLQAEITRLQTENTTAAQKHAEELSKLTYNTAAEKFISGLKPKDELSKKAILAEFTAKGFKLDGDNFVGGKEWAEEFKKANESHFQSETPPPAIFSGKAGAQLDPNKSPIGDLKTALYEKYNK